MNGVAYQTGSFLKILFGSQPVVGVELTPHLVDVFCLSYCREEEIWKSLQYWIQICKLSTRTCRYLAPLFDSLNITISRDNLISDSPHT